MVVPCFDCPHLKGWAVKRRAELIEERAKEIGLKPHEGVIIMVCAKARENLSFFERYLTSEEAPTCHYKEYLNSGSHNKLWLRDLYDAWIINLETVKELLEDPLEGAAIDLWRYFIHTWYIWRKKKRLELLKGK
jgi:hypothetical protein